MIQLFSDTHGARIDVVDEPTLLHTLASLRDNPDTAFVYVDEEGAEEFQSYAALVAEAEQIGRSLLALGLQRGDRVALVLPRAREFVPLFWGAVRAGLVPVPMAQPVRVDTLDVWRAAAGAILASAGARLLVVAPELLHVGWSLAGGPLALVRSRAQLVDAEAALPELGVIAPSDVCFLQFTSGSTSRPRGVRVTHASLVANTDAIMRDGLETRPGDKTLSWLPLYHDMGLIGFVISTVRYRTPTVLLPTLRFVMRPTIWMAGVSKHRATITFAPNFAYALAARRAQNTEALDLSCLRVLGCGAEPIQAASQRAFFGHFAAARLDPRASLACYGMAEATLAMSFVALDAPLQVDRIASEPYRTQGKCLLAPDDADALEVVCCGTPMKGHSVTVRSPDGAPLPDRRVGELYFAGPSVADGYDGDPVSSAATFTEFGIRTGDLGYMADGRVYVTGRRKDLLILNGRNYDPHDVEARVAAVEGVREGNVVAFSVPGTDTERLVIALEVKVPKPELEAQVQQHLQTGLGLRATLVLLPGGTLPKTSSGKLQRRATRDQYLAGTLERSAATLARRTATARATLFGVDRQRLATPVKNPLLNEDKGVVS